MMQAKALEIRDEGTFIAALAVDMNPDTDGGVDEELMLLLKRCGYACDYSPNVILTRLDGNGHASNDPNSWTGRTWPIAHDYIIKNWEILENGSVIDVQFILGETSAPKTSELEGVSND